MLSTADKKKLRTLGQALPNMIQIGKGGLTENLLTSLDNDLEAHELVKVNLLKTCEMEVREAAIECASQTGAEIVQIIGRTFVLYRRSKANKLEIGR